MSNLRRRAARALLAAACLLVAPGVPYAWCRATSEVVPETAVLGQQILHRVRIERGAHVQRIEWIDPPRFADFRVEWLPGSHERRESAADGSPRFVREELRALFPLRAGELLVSEARIECFSAGDADGAPGRRELVVPGLRVRTRHATMANRPAGWSGLVGRVHVRLAPLPHRMELGETLRVSIAMRGAANLWDEPSPLDGESLAAGDVPVDLFPAESRIDLERGTRLSLRRFDRVDVVPRATGVLEIRTREIVWYDAEKQTYQTTKAVSASVEVVAGGSPIQSSNSQ